MWILSRKGASGFSASSTAEQVTHGVDGTGLTAIVTGASSGIGVETTRVLALRGVHVIMAVRNVESGKKVKEAITEKIPGAKIDIMELDLSSLESVRKFAYEYNSSGRPLNILINNAGILAPPFTLSKDNIELQFATNHIGHFVLTNLLLDNMKATARNCQKEGRIVIVASDAHRLLPKEGVCFDKIVDSSSYNSMLAYGESKLANILHANELAKRLKEEGVHEVTVNSLHPGVIATPILRNQYGWVEGLFNYVISYFLKNIPQGASTTCYVALNPQLKGVSGEYFADNNVGKRTAFAKDADMAKKLWDLSLKLTEST